MPSCRVKLHQTTLQIQLFSLNFSMLDFLAMSQASRILRYWNLITCNFGTVISMEHFLVSKESTQRELSFEIKSNSFSQVC